MRHRLAAACLTFSLASVQSVIADPSVQELAARTEVRPIETLTLTDQQFLTGDKNAAKAAVDRRRVAPAAGRHRAAAGRRAAARLGRRRSAARSSGRSTFNEMGIASFLVDSFSGRGLTSLSANQALLGRFNMILDAYRAQPTLSRASADRSAPASR